MRRRALVVTAVAALSVTSGCGGGHGGHDAGAGDWLDARPDGGPDGGEGGDAQFDVHWTLTAGDSEVAIDCGDAGAYTIKVTSVGEMVGTFVDLFDCTDGYNATAPLPLDDYTVWIDALDASDDLIAQSSSKLVTLDLDGELVTVNFEFPVDGGFFYLGWNVLDAADESMISCNSAGAGTIEVVSTPVGSSGTSLSDIWDCTDYAGVTSKLPLDTYTVVVSLLEQGTGQSLSVWNPITETLEWGNELIDLGDFWFTVDLSK